MKRYSISYPYEVNEQASKSGIKFQYRDRTDNPEDVIERYKNSRIDRGLQIKDSVTKEIIFSDIRPIRGKLILTLTDEKRTWKTTEKFVDLGYMRELERKYLCDKEYGKDYGFSVVKVDREICKI
jgi:hypothetical protein